ncbi:MAG: histidine kinase, partial [Bacteroidetes bacterium]|nr:histidine kinase [Bacteroidota bacterium]
VFRKKGVPAYLLSLVGLMLFFSVFQLFLKEWTIPGELLHRHFDVFWAVVPVMFVTAISTGYGFIIYLLNQEKARQDEQQERLQSELSFLRSQISPHFIFNVLNSIVYLIRSKSALAETVTIKLSELMRYMLYESGDAQVPLEKEIEYLKNFVELQKIRFEEDVDIRLNIEGTPSPQLIEPMLMVPFVENAFKHGVGLIAGPVIDILLKINGPDLLFSVKNKISPQSDDDKDSSSGIGLRNVQRRLELLFPGRHQLTIQREDGWFSVKLSLKL